MNSSGSGGKRQKKKIKDSVNRHKKHQIWKGNQQFKNAKFRQKVHILSTINYCKIET